MFESLLISKKEISRFKVSPKNPLVLTCEKVTQKPRIYNTSQIKNAIDNISIIDLEEKILSSFLLQSAQYVLKDFFLQMHQTGLYNRQSKLWKTLGNVTQFVVYRLEKGILKKKETNFYIIEYFIDPKSPCICAIVQDNLDTNYNVNDLFPDFKTYLSKVLTNIRADRIKGIFFISYLEPSFELITKLENMTSVLDPISKYESILSNTKDTRLNYIVYKSTIDEIYTFTHQYPNIKHIRSGETKVLK